MAKNKTIQKFISSLMVFVTLAPIIFLYSTPKKAEAQETAALGVPVNDFPVQIYSKIITKNTGTSSFFDTKEWMQKLLEQLLKVAAKRLLAQMTQATINWINSGFHGSPLFLENPESFFRDIAKSEIKSLVDMIGYDTFRFPFGPQTALNVINSYKRQLAENSQYTLSKVINDPDLLVRYRNDFNYGGWNGFLINTQYPQNNYLGFNMIIQQNLASRLEGTLQAPAQKVRDALQQGMGFLSPQVCPSNPKYNNGINEFLRPSFKPTVKHNNPNPYVASEDLDPEGYAKYQEYERNYDVAEATEREAWAVANTCPGGLVNTTPGSVAANQIFSGLNTPFLSTALDGAIGNSIAAIFDALINKLLDTGLNALSGTISGASSSVDNWSYNGQTLNGGTALPDTSATVLNIPSSVSLTAGQMTSTTIRGAKAHYSIKTPPYDSAVAKAEISVSGSSGPILIVTGIGPGSTSFTVQDSSTSCPQQNLPTQCVVTVAVNVNNLGDLKVVPANITVGVDNPVTATISGGEEPYSMITSPNQSVAIASLAGTNLITTGVAMGGTYVEIKDSSTPPKIVKINIVISPTERGALNIPQNIPVFVGNTINSLPISGGTAPYIIVTMYDPKIADAQILGPNFDTLTITGKKKGETQIMIKDSSLDTKFDNTNIVVTEPLIVSLVNYAISVCGYNNCGWSRNLSITGGTGDYSIQSPPTPGIATARITDNNLRITTYKTAGSTSITIKDSANPPQTFTVNINVY